MWGRGSVTPGVWTLSVFSALPLLSGSKLALSHGQVALCGVADPAAGTYSSCLEQCDWHPERFKPGRREAARAWHCISYKHGCFLLLQIIGYRPGAGVPVSVDCKVQVLLSSVLGSVVGTRPNVSSRWISQLAQFVLILAPNTHRTQHCPCLWAQLEASLLTVTEVTSLLLPTLLLQSHGHHPGAACGAGCQVPARAWSSVGRCRNCSYPSPAAPQHPQSWGHPASQQQWGEGRAPTAQAAAGSHP